MLYYNTEVVNLKGARMDIKKIISYFSIISSILMATTANSAVYNAALDSTIPIEVDSKDVVLKDISKTISPDKISGSYKFQNSTEKRINVVMAYKFPQLTSDYMHGKAYKDFSIKLNGENLSVSESRKAILNNRDITSNLKKAGLDVPADSCMRGGDKKFVTAAKSLNQKQKNELSAIGVDIDNILKGDCWLPWDLEISYYWTVSLDANQEVEIEQSYSPVLTSFAIPLISEKIKQDYCIDEETYKAIKDNIGFGKMYPYFFEEIDSASKNWKGEIEKSFIKAESKKVGSYVFSCMSGFSRKSEFEISSEQYNIEPAENLKVLFLLKN